MKLAALNPRFLLESVEGGERLARYSFIGFGDCLELKVDTTGVTIGKETEPLPKSGAELLQVLRRALALSPRPRPTMPGVPLAGGLVGYAAYDVVRFFERLPARRSNPSAVPAMHYVAPQSLLVFDHLTRGIALLHAGSDDERRSLRTEVIRALRGALPHSTRAGRFDAPTAAFSREDFMAGVRRTRSTSPQEMSISWCCRRALAGAMRLIPSRRIARCGSSIPRPTCTTAPWAR